ncbi:MAG: MoxR family ATPase [Planctomycetes bacterium]|nr:MoxR family ATPase [Planctomycetota bacterium]
MNYRPSTPAAERSLKDSPGDRALVEKLHSAYGGLRAQLAKVIVGQERVIDLMLAAMFSGGHCLLIGVPGLAKTLLVSTLARVLSLSFKRVQFTPDLMPSDILGTEILQEDPATGHRAFRFLKGPVFTHMLLADEINRTPPKTQAALLEAMQERHVTVGEKTLPLPEPFFVLATQNPIEHEGTYPLPEAQLDRFMFSIQVRYPSEEEELKIMKRTTNPQQIELSQVLNSLEIRELQGIVPRVPAGDHVYQFALKLVRRTRPDDPQAPTCIQESLSWGAGPRAAQYLMLGAKARALLKGRFHAACEDVEAVAEPVLAHRLVTNFNADAEGITSASLVARLLSKIPRE